MAGFRLSDNMHRNIFIGALSLISVGLFFSVFLVSVGGIALAANWLWEGNLKSKMERLKKNAPALLIISVFLMHVLGLLWTQHDFGYAFKDIKIKLPLLLSPVVLGTSRPFNKLEEKIVGGFFLASAFTATCISYYLYLTRYPFDITDIRDISQYISHIRFSLLLVTAVIIIFAGFIRGYFRGYVGFIAVVLAVWFIYFVSLLNVISGVLGVFAVITAGVIMYTGRLSKRYRAGIIALFLIAISLFTGRLVYIGQDYLSLKDDFDYSVEETPAGEKYKHNFKSNHIENGYYVERFIAPEELKAAWSERSSLNLDSTDKRNQKVEQTLIRFLTSKGVKKDREGVEDLTDKEVKAIENGIASSVYLEKSGFEKRFLKVLYELNRYFDEYNPQGHSVAMRLEFAKTGYYIFQNNFWTGVGTGDVPYAFEKGYEELENVMSQNYRYRAHNQYLTMAITFGVFGFVLFVVSLIVPVFYALRRQNKLYILFALLAVLSMFSEDTLETQIGVTFFTFGTCVLLFMWRSDDGKG